ncbi:uncharacterized protein LOC132188443 [Corylus avellana]|uniref:uncharacterized protein LOC132188443 n=1 Tax=Corylus avellana TaxID=13451 RepID=UPI001E1FF91D|nr:uncharacterized protein LOC132188443 [Corylus avellana]XP_059458870.1 uncharacterized protein LOC132188443 [Corylus avellana]XP_059458871.1 uncharacterized protein LOC132188443 [Corylus avellana]XP_059458872.1 uncharacterized protein LOC132188443 [Corylus avellana]XP_059458873.1 uncharacterized protein LOC132188443 [Corylus avellana]XP_059458874.1 uncharacterized protein LOC132188443 [Corylus avellana]
MHGFSTVDGFVEITECLAEMIKYIANEPSVGLFYVQQHTQNAVPNTITLKNNVVDKSREMTLHAEDSEDSISMVKSMKECGFPIADEMIRDIKKSLVIMSTKQPRRGLIHNPASGFQMGRTSSWGPATWGRTAVFAQEDKERRSSYFQSVFKSAKQKASNFKWPQLDPRESIQTEGEKLLPYPTTTLSVTSASTSSSLLDVEVDELPLSSRIEDEPLQEEEEKEEEEEEEEEEENGVSLPSPNLLSVPEDFDDFKADKEAKLKEWLEGTDNSKDHRDKSDAKGL